MSKDSVSVFTDIILIKSIIKFSPTENPGQVPEILSLHALIILISGLGRSIGSIGSITPIGSIWIN